MNRVSKMDSRASAGMRASLSALIGGILNELAVTVSLACSFHLFMKLELLALGCCWIQK